MKTKSLDINKFLGDLLQRERITAIGEDGYFQGKPFNLNLDLQWSTRVSSGNPRMDEYPHDDISLKSHLGAISIKKPIVTKWNSDGSIEGKAISFEINTKSINPNEKYKSFTIVPITAEDWTEIAFPDYIEDKNENYKLPTWLPLKLSHVEIDFYIINHKKYKPCAVIEIELIGSAILSSCEISGAARQLISYMLGLPLAGSTRSVVICSQGNIIQFSSHLGRSDRYRKHRYPPIPGNMYALSRASEQASKLSPPLDIKRKLDAAVISLCLDKYIKTPKLVAPLEYLLHASGLPVEMYGALCAIALEALTDEMESAGLLKTVKPLEDEKWRNFKSKLKDVLTDESLSWNEEQTKIIKSRIENLNSPANSQKLSRPFDLLGLVLTDSERESIKLRNKYLHEGRLLNPNKLLDPSENWQEVQKIDMSLYTAVNKLFLKYLGYSGAVFNYGDKQPQSRHILFSFI